MSDLDNLRPEVRKAFDQADMYAGSYGHGFAVKNAWETLRVELLRLTAMEHAWKQWIKDGMRVEFLPPEPPK